MGETEERIGAFFLYSFTSNVFIECLLNPPNVCGEDGRGHFLRQLAYLAEAVTLLM